MKIYKYAAVAIAALLAVMLAGTSVGAAGGKFVIVTENSKIMKVDGNDIQLVVESQRINDRLMLPLRAFAEDALGCTVVWDETTKTATITNNESTIIVTENSKIMNVDGRDILMDVEPQRVDDRLLLPIRAFAENAMGCEVIWDESTKTASITAPAAYSASESPAKVAETEEPSGPKAVITNPYSVEKVSELWTAAGYTRSHNDLSYILGYFIYELCIEREADPISLEFEKIEILKGYKAGFDSSGKFTATFSNYETATKSKPDLESLVHSYLREVYAYLLKRDNLAGKENMVAFYMQRNAAVPSLKERERYPWLNTDPSKQGYVEIYEGGIPPFADNSLLFDYFAGDFYAGVTVEGFNAANSIDNETGAYTQGNKNGQWNVSYEGRLTSGNRMASYTYKEFHDPNPEIEVGYEKFPFMNGFNYMYTTKRFNAAESTNKLMLECLTVEKLTEFPMLNYLYGVKNGRAYVKTFKEIEEYTAERLNVCKSFSEARDILTVYYNIPAMYGVDCPQSREVADRQEKVVSGSIKPVNIKAAEDFAAVRPLTDTEVRELFKKLTGKDLTF